MMREHVLVEVEPPRGRLVLNRPERRNALSLDAMREVTSALEELSATTGVAVIVVEARGPAFSAGHDIAEMVGRDPGFYDQLFSQCTAMMQTIHGVTQPVIAKVAGVATAAGCQLVASCDLVVASQRASFATPGVRIGLFCTTPMVPVTKAVGRKRAMEMLLTGEPIDASTAMSWGLVNRVVPPEQLDAAVDHLVDQITQWSRDVIGIGKRAFYRQVDLPEDAAYELTQPIMAANAAAPDAQEGFDSFLGKRAPVWSHEAGGESGLDVSDPGGRRGRVP
jgi:enoyl-CoA hydratase/carnithine racemase